MAKFVVELDNWAQEINSKFGLAYREVFPVMKMALYEGARVTADAVNRAADRNGVPWHCGVSEHKRSGDGFETSVGYREGGYFYNRNGVKTPIDLVVNVMNSGTSKRPGNHFFDRATRSVKSLAQGVMMKKYSEEIMKIIGD